jgi:hypothetical protein
MDKTVGDNSTESAISVGSKDTRHKIAGAMVREMMAMSRMAME